MPVNLVLWVWVPADLVVDERLHLADVYVGSVRKTKEHSASERWEYAVTRFRTI